MTQEVQDGTVAEIASEAPEPEQQPKGRLYSDEEISQIEKSAAEKAKLEIRHEVTSLERKRKDFGSFESLAQATARMQQDNQQTQDLVAMLLDKQAQAEGNAPQQSYLEAMREARKPKETPASYTPDQIAGITRREAERLRIQDLIEEAGLEMEDERFNAAAALFTQGQTKDSVKEVKRIIAESTKVPEKPKTAQEKVRELGESPDIELPKPAVSQGPPGGIGKMTQEAYAARISQPDGLKWMAQNDAEIEKAHRRWLEENRK